MKALLTLMILGLSQFLVAQTTTSNQRDSIVYKRTIWDCEKGTKDAANDFKDGKYNCYSYGLIVQTDPEFDEFLQKYRKKTYGIISKNAGCVISEHSECYSKVMTELVYEKFGKDIFEKSLKEAQELYKKTD